MDSSFSCAFGQCAAKREKERKLKVHKFNKTTSIHIQCDQLYSRLRLKKVPLFTRPTTKITTNRTSFALAFIAHSWCLMSVILLPENQAFLAYCASYKHMVVTQHDGHYELNWSNICCARQAFVSGVQADTNSCTTCACIKLSCTTQQTSLCLCLFFLFSSIHSCFLFVCVCVCVVLLDSKNNLLHIECVRHEHRKKVYALKEFTSFYLCCFYGDDQLMATIKQTASVG